MCIADYIIIRHRKENLKKCSLRGFELDRRFTFLTYPIQNEYFTDEICQNALVLDMEGEILTKETIPPQNETAPLIVIDATWRYACSMIQSLPQLKKAKQYTLPKEWTTAYPRKQTQCPDPERGLASIEALYIAAFLLGRSVHGILDKYYWKDLFLEKNKHLLH